MSGSSYNQGRARLSAEVVEAILLGGLDDPCAVLGPHEIDGRRHVTVFHPGAVSMAAVACDQAYLLGLLPGAPGVFHGPVPGLGPYRLQATGEDDVVWLMEDPYRFAPVLGEIDEYLIGEGTHHALWRVLGAHVRTHQGVTGTHFAVWAPNARRVAVVGDFNRWDVRQHGLRRRGVSGLWEIFLPGVGEGATYKYAITGPDGVALPLKADPVGFGSQHPPETASIVRDIGGYGWRDAGWMGSRAGANARTAPISIYEVYLGSWRRKAEGRRISYREAAEELVGYAVEMGFTHLELLPISEYPFDGSWGYQPLGLYAPTVRHGPPHEFRDLVDAAHLAGLGVILDWVSGHFPTDAHGLGRFDGTALYEHADPKEGFHHDWNTLVFDYGRREVKNYLIANALYWLEEYHIDGLRVDAVASMLYRDYSRQAGEWVPNKDGGNENYEAVDFLRAMNVAAYGAHPGILTVAEESTSFPKVSAPVHEGGLGFGFKWNMGWMNDTLRYMTEDPVNRKYHHEKVTFGLHYAFSENFVLPISHDEVVHGKRSMYTRMPGDHATKLANLRAYYGFMWGHPGKKLLFMGQEFGQVAEWSHDAEIGWHHLTDPGHKGLQRLVRDLNTLYRATPALHVKDAEADGFDWLTGDDADHSVIAWLRRGNSADKPVVMLTNFTPVERSGYRIGLPHAGAWREALNTDAALYGGGDRGNMGRIEAAAMPSHGQPASAGVYLPPLSTLFLLPDD